MTSSRRTQERSKLVRTTRRTLARRDGSGMPDDKEAKPEAKPEQADAVPTEASKQDTKPGTAVPVPTEAQKPDTKPDTAVPTETPKEETKPGMAVAPSDKKTTDDVETQ